MMFAMQGVLSKDEVDDMLYSLFDRMILHIGWQHGVTYFYFYTIQRSIFVSCFKIKHCYPICPLNNQERVIT